MKKILLASMFMALMASAMAAYQFNTKGNQGWVTFDSETTVSFDLGRSGKDKDHENFIDRGEGVVDYGWYNLVTGEKGSFKDGLSATFSQDDRIGLYVTDNTGKTYTTTKTDKSPFDNNEWGHAKLEDGNMLLGGGNMGSNGTHEFYVFKVNNTNASGKGCQEGSTLLGQQVHERKGKGGKEGHYRFLFLNRLWLCRSVTLF